MSEGERLGSRSMSTPDRLLGLSDSSSRSVEAALAPLAATTVAAGLWSFLHLRRRHPDDQMSSSYACWRLLGTFELLDPTPEAVVDERIQAMFWVLHCRPA